ncbi:MAG TPA: serine/threonine-protein kinase, partial [Streptosporangiaceae bacterium]|nr:serine/threonine-protein kinase [Streptosporangiaceae bacterium]
DESVRRELGSQFRIERLLGRGGMSLVYLARELELNRLVAVKVLPIQLSMGNDAVERFRREAKIGASLDHPHIVPVHRIGSTPTFLWYSLKWVKGGSLRDVLDKRGPMSLVDCLRVLEPVAAALYYGHRRGVVHRDVKPANILIDDTGWVGICDFGIAKAFGATPLTNTGATLGTPGYMAPEQCYGKPLDGRADQYSLAVLAYECLAGQVPFTGDSLGEIVRKHCMEPAPRITAARADLPESVADALDRALSKHPGDRFPTVLDLVRGLGGDPTRSSTALAVTTDEASVASPAAPSPPTPRLRARAAWVTVIVAVALGTGALALAGRNGPAVPPPALPAAAPQVDPGRLSLNATPWGDVFLDGQPVGQTPLANLSVTPGRHRLRISRSGFEPYEQDIEIASGQRVVMTDIVLKPAQAP